jgi:NADPH:quinone reductase-like Zn-dependent oxidoreductase
MVCLYVVAVVASFKNAMLTRRQSDDQLIRAPANLSSEQIAALPMGGGTVMNALFFGPKPLQKGMTVLTQGKGGVTCFAIQVRPFLFF